MELKLKNPTQVVCKDSDTFCIFLLFFPFSLYLLKCTYSTCVLSLLTYINIWVPHSLEATFPKRRSCLRSEAWRLALSICMFKREWLTRVALFSICYAQVELVLNRCLSAYLSSVSLGLGLSGKTIRRTGVVSREKSVRIARLTFDGSVFVRSCRPDSSPFLNVSSLQSTVRRVHTV